MNDCALKEEGCARVSGGRGGGGRDQKRVWRVRGVLEGSSRGFEIIVVGYCSGLWEELRSAVRGD